MTYRIMPIIITPAQIAAIAQVIASDQANEQEQPTPEQWQAATEHWLRAKINDILVDVDWHARNDFSIEPTCQGGGCRKAPLPHSVYCRYHTDQAIEDGETGRTVPVVPTVARPSTAIVQRRELTPEPDGNILWV